jgi:hypothetical protein
MIRTVAFIAALAFALPAVAQEKPAVTFQAKSPAALLSHIREVVRTVGDKEGLDQFEEQLKDRFGEEGFQGLNLTQPILGYARLDGKPEETSFVLVVPISKEKDFLELLERMEAKVEAVEDDKGAYRLGDPDIGALPKFFRMTATHAYIAFNGTAKTVAAKALIPVKDLLDETEAGLFVLHLHPDRAGKEYREKAVKGLEKLAANENLGDTETKWVKGVKPMAEMLLGQTERLTLRGDIDPGTKMAALDFKLVPKKNSLLSIAFAARKPSANHFAGAGKAADYTQLMLLTFPGWTKDICEGMSASLTDFGNFTKLIFAQGPAMNLQPAVGKLIEGMAAAAKEGNLDLISITTAPDKAGLVTNAFAIRAGKPEDVEKELLALAQTIADTDAQLAKKINLTAAKHAGFAIHTFDLADYLDKPMKDMLGEDAKLAVACGKDAVYFAVGSKAIDGVKQLMDAKPGEAAAFDTWLQPKALAKAYRGMGLMETVEKAFGTGDKPMRVMALTATSSAAELNVRAEMSLAFIKLAMALSMAGQAAP